MDSYEYKKQVDVDKFLSEYGPELSNLRQIWITGGEPFIDDSVYIFFNKLARYTDLSNIAVTINTNASRLNVNELSKLDHLLKLSINVSVDATGDYYNYMRGNNLTFSELDKIMRQLTQFSRSQQNLLITVNGAFQLYNLTNIGEFFYWVRDVLDLIDARYIEHRVLTGPPQLRVRNAPETLKAESRSQVDKLLNEFPNQFYLLDIRDELDKPSKKSHIQRFITWNQELDILRQQSIHDILPSLYTDWQTEGHII